MLKDFFDDFKKLTLKNILLILFFTIIFTFLGYATLNSEGSSIIFFVIFSIYVLIDFKLNPEKYKAKTNYQKELKFIINFSLMLGLIIAIFLFLLKYI